MSDMKCPFCNTPLVHENMSDYWCVHCNTQEQKGLYGSDKLWQELIRTRKALEIAVDALKDNLSQANFTQMLDASRFHCIRTRCESALAEITAISENKNGNC